MDDLAIIDGFTETFSRYIDTGFTASRPLLEKAGELIGITSFFTNFVTIVVLMLAWLIVLLAFFILSVQLFITIVEFKLTVLAGFVLVPFAPLGRGGPDNETCFKGTALGLGPLHQLHIGRTRAAHRVRPGQLRTKFAHGHPCAGANYQSGASTAEPKVSRIVTKPRPLMIRSTANSFSLASLGSTSATTMTVVR
jgi:hypothetical protein